MDIHIHLYSWYIPMLVTILCLGYVKFFVKPRGQFLSGLNNLFAYGCAIIISLLTWTIWGIVLHCRSN